MANFSQPTGKEKDNSNDWTTVQGRKNNNNQVRKESGDSNLIKTKVTITLRVPVDKPADYSAAEIHIATIKELMKQDNNLIVLDSSGTTQVNIHKAIGPEKYKALFSPREKAFNNGGGQVSVAHYILSENSSFNKSMMYTFLQKNKVFIYFNQKEGLEHFAAIGVLFGPHPDYAWRQDTIDSLENTMKADLQPDEREKLTKNSKTQVVIQLTPQQVSNTRYSKVKSVALEIRVPAEHERVYTGILDRLNERASNLQAGEVDLVLDDRIGVFFPYYAKNERPQLFEKLMRKQNSDMSSCSVIPIFGYTSQAAAAIIKDNDGKEMTLSDAIMSHPNIRKIEKTASSSNVGKFLVIVDRHMKDSAEDFLDEVFSRTPELENQPMNFTKPQRGGNAFRKARVNNINNYLNKLEQKIEDENYMYVDDDEDTTPPPRPKKFTISYAQAITNSSNAQKSTSPTGQISASTSATTTTSTLTQESLDEALQRFREETNNTIAALRDDLNTKVLSMEERITNAIVNAMKTPREITTIQEQSENNSEATTALGSDRTVTTLIDKVDSLADAVSILAKSVEILKNEHQTQQKRNRISLPPSTPDKIMGNSQDRSPPSKQQRSRAPSPTLPPPPPKGHPINSITGSQEAN
jgi:hypothetical protein